MVRTLIDRIEFTPTGNAKKQTSAINLHGGLADMPAFAPKSQTLPRQDGRDEEAVKLVAGAGLDWSRLALADGLMPGNQR